MKDYRKLLVWQKAHQLTLDGYKILKGLPKEEMFGLTIQMKRSATSIPTNIAEGCGRNTDKDFRRFLTIAFGSSNELEYQTILSEDLNFVEKKESEKILTQIAEVKKMLSSLISKLTANR